MIHQQQDHHDIFEYICQKIEDLGTTEIDAGFYLFSEFNEKGQVRHDMYGQMILQSILKTSVERNRLGLPPLIVRLIIDSPVGLDRIADLPGRYPQKEDESNSSYLSFKRLLNSDPDIVLDIRVHEHTSRGALHSKYVIVKNNKLDELIILSANVVSTGSMEACSVFEGQVIAFYKHYHDELTRASRSHLKSNLNIDYDPNIPVNYSREGEFVLAMKNDPLNQLVSEFPPNANHIALLEAIKLAKRSIKIMSPNLQLSDIWRATIKQAKFAKENNEEFKVQIITTEGMSSDVVWLMGSSTLVTYEKLMREAESEGVAECFELNRVRDSAGELQPTFDMKLGNHIKLCIIDDELIIQGSYNLKKQSRCSSRETQVVFRNRSYITNGWIQLFDKQFKIGSKEHSNPDIERRSNLQYIIGKLNGINRVEKHGSMSSITKVCYKGSLLTVGWELILLAAISKQIDKRSEGV